MPVSSRSRRTLARIANGTPNMPAPGLQDVGRGRSGSRSQGFPPLSMNRTYTPAGSGRSATQTSQSFPGRRSASNFFTVRKSPSQRRLWNGASADAFALRELQSAPAPPALVAANGLSITTCFARLERLPAPARSGSRSASPTTTSSHGRIARAPPRPTAAHDSGVRDTPRPPRRPCAATITLEPQPRNRAHERRMEDAPRQPETDNRHRQSRVCHSLPSQSRCSAGYNCVGNAV